MAQSIRISDRFYALTHAVCSGSGRSLAQQLEYWARLGARLDLGMTATQSLALLSDNDEAKALVLSFLRTPEPGATAQTDIAARHARDAVDVARGARHAESLVVIPKAMAQAAKLTFGKDAFGAAEPW